jgi:hypothetical protein
MHLADLQQCMAEAMLGNTKEVACIVSTKTLSAKKRLSIYRESIFSQMILALEEVFPVCVKLVGKKCFYALARKYAEKYFSADNLNVYGERFADFIRTIAPLSEQLPYLPEVAVFEYAMNEGFYAKTSKPFDVKTVEVSESLVFSLTSGATLLDLHFPIYKIWSENQKPESEQSTINLDEGGEKLLVFRKGMEMQVAELSVLQWDFLQQVKAGKNFVAICECFIEHGASKAVSEILQEAVLNAWIIRKA